MRKYKSAFIKLCELENYLNEMSHQWWTVVKISDPERTSQANANISVADDSTRFSVLVVLQQEDGLFEE